MKLFRKKQLVSQLMTKLANEQITSQLLRKEVAQLKDELNISHKAVEFEQQLSRRLMEQLEKGH